MYIGNYYLHMKLLITDAQTPAPTTSTQKEEAQNRDHQPTSVHSQRVRKFGDEVESDKGCLRLYFNIQLEWRLKLADLRHARKEHLQQAGEEVLRRHNSATTLTAENLSSAR